MSNQRYTASQTPTRDGTGRVMSFRHPLRKDARGKQGRKMRRGLATGDEARARALVDEMNVLLGDSKWHSIAKRSEAERCFDPIVVRAFYDDIESPSHDSWSIRDTLLPLPTAEDGYARVMMVGTTGAGKTSLLRHLIGSHPTDDRFPSTSASRTTISDIEVITSNELTYRAVVTFFDESTVHTHVHECVADACAALWGDMLDERLAERFLTHRDERFRLGHIIGSWRQANVSSSETDNGWDYDGGESEKEASYQTDDGALPTASDVDQMHEMLRSFLTRLRDLATDAKKRLQTELDVDLDTVSGSDKEAAQDLFEDIVQTLPDFDDLVNDIMDEIRLRFRGLAVETLQKHSGGWPEFWRYESTDRTEFIRAVRRFSSNYAAAFGTLLTPLVNGIRIQGQFFPTFADRRSQLVLLDGEGLGHVGDPAAGVASRVAKRFETADVILLVDSAKAAMLEAPVSVLRAIAASGYQKRLAIAFTHFDLLRGLDNLPTFESQRAHVLSSVHQKLSSLKEVVGQPAVRAIERGLDARCFMLGFLDRPLTEKNRGPVGEINRLLDFCDSAIEAVTPPHACPVYDTAGLVLAIQAAAADFHRRWDAILGFRPSGSVRTAHWAEVKALNRRVVLDIEDNEYKDLKPVADLVARLSESITKFLARPIRWKPRPPVDAEADEALSHLQRAVSARLYDFVDSRILRVPQKRWVEAFDYRGRGSTRERAKVIQAIYDASAPVPGPALDPSSEEFLREVRLLVHDAVADGGGEMVSDLLGQPVSSDATVSDVARPTQ